MDWPFGIVKFGDLGPLEPSKSFADRTVYQLLKGLGFRGLGFRV